MSRLRRDAGAKFTGLFGALLLFGSCSDPKGAARPVQERPNSAGGAAPVGVGGAGGPSAVGGGAELDVPDASLPSGECENLQCRLNTCANGSTSLTGTVYAPNGTLPLYNAVVYVPNAPLPEIPDGLTCDRCGSIPPGEPLVSALTDPHGVFKLPNVPAGDGVPLVIQVGKWRRQVTLPHLTACTENKLTDPDLTRLPRTQSEGHIPHIALTTGGCDNLICLISKLGISESEFGVQGENKAVTFFSGAPSFLDPVGMDRFDAHLTKMTSATSLWGNANELRKYDMAVFSCECEEALGEKGPAAYAAVTQYLASGGRVFGTDYQYVWYQHSTDPNLASVATIPGADASGNPNGTSPILLDTSFPKGKALADWYSYITPDATYGAVESDTVFDNFSAVRQPAAQVWGSSTRIDGTAPHPRFITVNTPALVPPAQQCGKAVHLDAHVTSSGQPRHYPIDCGAALDNGEKVLAFFFFDVAACIQEDNKPVEPPPVVK